MQTIAITAIPWTLLCHITGNVEVHSLYRHNINLQAKNMLLTLQPKSGLRTPLSVITVLPDDLFAQLNIRCGDKGVVSEGVLSFPGYRFLVAPQEIWEPHISTRKLPARHLFFRAAKKIDAFVRQNCLSSPIAAAMFANHCGVLCGQLEKAFYERFAVADAGSVQGNIAKTVDAYAELVGLGNGLTPAGDDFLVGLLSVLWFTDVCRAAAIFRKLLTHRIRTLLRTTTDISGEFLKHACDGQFSVPLVVLFNSSAENLPLERIRSIGHSSGMDTLCGVLEGLHLFFSKFFPCNDGDDSIRSMKQ